MERTPSPGPSITGRRPTLEEFLADIESEKAHNRVPLVGLADMNECLDYMNNLFHAGYSDDSRDLMLAREAALANTGFFANTDPERVWELVYGGDSRPDDTHLEQQQLERAEEETQLAEAATNQLISESNNPRMNEARPRLKRIAAERAHAAWDCLSPRKRQRRE